MTLKTCYFDERLRNRCSAAGFQSGSQNWFIAPLQFCLGPSRESRSLWDQVKREPKRSTVPQLRDFLDHQRWLQEQSVRPYVRAAPDTSTPFLPEGYNT